MNTNTDLNGELEKAHKVVEEGEEEDDGGEQPTLAQVHRLGIFAIDRGRHKKCYFSRLWLKVLDAFLINIMQLSIIGTMKIFSEAKDVYFAYQTNLVEKVDQSCISLHCNSHHCVHTEHCCHLRHHLRHQRNM